MRFDLSPLFDCDARDPDLVAELAAIVATPGSFSLRELGGSTDACAYRVRDSDVALHIRHGTRDLGILDEIFLREYYELPERLRPAPRNVVDLGANVGLFGVWLLDRFPDARITAFEPDRHNLELLERCAADNGGAERWRIVPACAAASDGAVPFLHGDFCGSRITEEAPELAPAVDVFPYLEGADLLKMDIEGGEWDILAEPRLAGAGVGAICMEYHPHRCPGAQPRDTAEQLLHAAGFETELLFDRPDGVGMLWAYADG